MAIFAGDHLSVGVKVRHCPVVSSYSGSNRRTLLQD